MEIHKIDNLDIHLAQPDNFNFSWTGCEDTVNQLLACWMVLGKYDLPLNPRLIGKPGVGKTTLACAVAQKTGRPFYIMQATMDTRPEDLILTPVIKEAGKLKYVASPLLTAMIKGGVCVLDEGNRMSEKSWASLAPLLDARRYVESIIGGIKIHAHPEFRFVATMNDDASTYEIPEYINSRLQPQIYLDFPSENEEMEILRQNLPYTSDELLEKVCSFLQKSHDLNEDYTVRDGINIASYAMRLIKFHKLDPEKSLKDSIKMILGPEAASIIDKQTVAFKDPLSPFTGPKGLV